MRNEIEKGDTLLESSVKVGNETSVSTAPSPLPTLDIILKYTNVNVVRLRTQHASTAPLCSCLALRTKLTVQVLKLMKYVAVGSVEIVANNNGACAYTTLSREETVQKESMIATTYEKIHSELKSTITRIGEVKMPEARSTTVLGIESGVTRGKEKMKQELNRKISKSRAKESGFIKGPDIRPCPEPAQRQTGLTREMRELNLKQSVATSSVTVELHRRQQLEMVKKRLEEYGEPYLVGDYNKFMMTFDSGCPAQFWIYANTEALYDLQAFIQVAFMSFF